MSAAKRGRGHKPSARRGVSVGSAAHATSGASPNLRENAAEGRRQAEDLRAAPRVQVKDRARAEAALQASEERYRCLIETSPDPLVTIDIDGRITDVNPATQKAVGRSRAELVGVDFAGLFTAPEQARGACRLVLENGMVRDHPMELCHSGGRVTPVLCNASVLRDEAGHVTGVLVLARDISKRRQAEENLEAQRKQFQDVLDMLPAYVILLSPDYHVRFANRFFRERFGEDRGSRCFEYLFGRSEPCDNCESYKVLKTCSPHRWKWTGPDGRRYDIFDFPFTPSDGSHIVLEMGIDITEQTQAAEALEKARDILEARVAERTAELARSNAQLLAEIEERKRTDKELTKERDFSSAVVDTAGALVVVLDPDGRIVRVNRACELSTGYSFKEVAGKYFWEMLVTAEEAEAVRAVFRRLRAGECPNEHENYWLAKDGTRRRIAWANTTLLDASGNVEFIIGTGIDVTERREAEEKTKKSLKEKDILLRELYHRVKNNLQVVSSLLRLQSRTLKEPEAVRALAESQSRIRSMALIHEKLYQSEDLANISFRAYMDSLVRASLMATLGVQKRISVKTIGDDLTMDLGTAIPCGLLLNELLSNALEHAFPQGRSGEIHVSFREIDREWVELSVRDDGVGFPEGLDYRRTESLGLRLVSTLAEDELQGKVELRRAGGTEFLIRFPRSHKQANDG